MISCGSNKDTKVIKSEQKADVSNQHLKYKSKLNYDVGRVQSLDFSCIASNQPINNTSPVLVKFELDDEDGHVKNIEYEKVKINLSPNDECIKALNRSALEGNFSYFYGLDEKPDFGVVDYFIVGDKKL